MLHTTIEICCPQAHPLNWWLCISARAFLASVGFLATSENEMRSERNSEVLRRMAPAISCCVKLSFIPPLTCPGVLGSEGDSISTDCIRFCQRQNCIQQGDGILPVQDGLSTMKPVLGLPADG